jgi:P27 family predicted phage terminase small subunit
MRGNPGRRPLNAEEPQPDALPVAVPAELVGNVEAVAEWNRVIVPAIEIGLITASDRAVAIAHCDLWSVWRSQLAEANSGPHIVHVGPNKHPTPNPARGIANSTFQLLRSVDVELGFTPSSRSRVKADPRSKRRKTAVEAFRARKAGA